MANSHSTDIESGSSQFWKITDASQSGLDITGSLSFLAWVNFESLPTSGNSMVLAGKDDDTGGASDRCWTCGITNTAGTLKLFFFASSDGSTGVTKSVDWTPSTATWYHVAYAYDAPAGEVSFYVDGSQQGSTQTGLPNSISDQPSPFVIGAFRVDSTPESFFDGLINDAIIYNAEVSSGTVSSNHSSPCSPNLTNAVSRWFSNGDNAEDQLSTNDLTGSASSPTFSTDVAYACTGVSLHTMTLLGVGV